MVLAPPPPPETFRVSAITLERIVRLIRNLAHMYSIENSRMDTKVGVAAMLGPAICIFNAFFFSLSDSNAAARALILSRLDYCNSLFNGLNQSDLKRLQRLQNKAARLIYLQPMCADATPLLQELHWLPVKQRIAFKTCTIMYKSLTNISPQYTILGFKQS